MNEMIRSKPPGQAGEAEDSARALVPAVDRAMKILALMESQPDACFTVSELARLLGIPKSTTFNICGALTEGQLLRRARDGFKLGPRLVHLGSAYVASINIVREFYDVGRLAPLDLGAGIQLAALEDFDIVYLAQQDCNSGLRLGLAGGVGRRIPANCSASGKALLAQLSPRELERRVSAHSPLPKLTRKSITSGTKLLRALAETRETGYGIADEEAFTGIFAIAKAMPTRSVESGHIAITISATKETLTPERNDRIRSVLDQLVDQLRARV